MKCSYRRERSEIKSHVFKTLLLGEKIVVFCGPAGSKLLLSNENKLIKVWWPSSVRQLLGPRPSIATNSGDEGMLMTKMVSYFVNLDTILPFFDCSLLFTILFLLLEIFCFYFSSLKS